MLLAKRGETKTNKKFVGREFAHLLETGNMLGRDRLAGETLQSEILLLRISLNW